MFPKTLKSPDKLCSLSSPVAEAIEKGLKCFVDVIVDVSGLEAPACWLLMTRKKSAAVWIAAAILYLPPGSAE